MVRDADRTFQSAALVDPAKPNAFSALERVYKIAKGLVMRYGNVRVFNAEPEHLPQGYESDPRSAVYINTSKGKALCTFSKLQTAVNDSANEAAKESSTTELLGVLHVVHGVDARAERKRNWRKNALHSWRFG